MGLCLSTHSPGAATPAGPTAAAMNPSSSSSWKGWTREKKRKRKEKGNNGRGDGNREGEEGGGNDRAMAAFSEEELHRLPGRMFLNAASEAACLYTQQGKKGTNQDAMLVWENFVSRSDTIFCGVFDGHGPFGHLVAKKVRDSLPLKLYTQWRRNISDHPHQNGSVPRSMSSEETASIGIGDEWTDPLDVDDDKKLPEMYLTLRQSLLRAFKSMDKELKLHSTIDCFCSGTTAVTIIKQGHDLVIGNVGDSRAILGARDNDGNLVAVQLTVDLKPNLPREAARIQQCRGRVFALQDEPEVARVWLPNNDSPGLAMARALGDFCLKDYGLISVPEISYRRLTEKDEFIVLATDGVWDALSNKEAVDIVASAPTRGTAARALVDCAVRAWRLKFPTSKIDDCAAICMYLKPRSSHQIQEDDLKESTKEPTELPLCSTAQAAINKEEVHESFISEIEIASSTHAHIHDDADEIVPIPDKPKEERVPGRSQSTRSLADCISNSEEDEWSALEGITRVNSLLNLPRFLSSDKRSAVQRKWKKSR